MNDFIQRLTNLAAQSLLRNQLSPGDPHVLVLVLGQDRQTVLDCELKPFSEVTALFASQQTDHTQPNAMSDWRP